MCELCLAADNNVKIGHGYSSCSLSSGCLSVDSSQWVMGQNPPPTGLEQSMQGIKGLGSSWGKSDRSLGTDYLVEIMQRETWSFFPLDSYYNCCMFNELFLEIEQSSYLHRKIYALEYCLYEYDSHLTAAVTFAAV